MTAVTTPLDAFLDAVRDFSSLPLVAIEQQPGKVDDFLRRVGGIAVLLGAVATPIDDDAVRDDIARCFRSVLASGVGRMALASYPLVAPALLTGLHHDDEFVRQIAAEQLRGLFADDAVRVRLHTVFADDDVLAGLLHVLADPSTTIAENVAAVLVTVADADRFFADSNCARLREVADGDATVLVRILGLAVRIGNGSPGAFDRFQQSGLLDDLFARISGGGDDPLLQMSLFGLLTELAHSKPGLQYLTQIPLGALLRRFAPGGANRALLTHVALGAIDEFINGAVEFGLFDWIGDPDLRVFLTESLDSDDGAVLEPAIGAVAAIGRCYAGLCEFSRDRHDLLFRLPQIAMRPDVSTNALAIAVLHGLATVLGARYDRAEQDRADAIRKAVLLGTPVDDHSEYMERLHRFMTKIRKWCGNVENGKLFPVPNSFAKWVSNFCFFRQRCRKDFVVLIATTVIGRAERHAADLRVAVYRFVSELGRSRFGVQAIVLAPGLVETLCGRHLEHNAKAKLWRFSALQAISTNPFLDEAAAGTPGLADRIRQHVHEVNARVTHCLHRALLTRTQGPYHKGTSVDVAVV